MILARIRMGSGWWRADSGLKTIRLLCPLTHLIFDTHAGSCLDGTFGHSGTAAPQVTSTATERIPCRHQNNPACRCADMVCICVWIYIREGEKGVVCVCVRVRERGRPRARKQARRAARAHFCANTELPCWMYFNFSSFFPPQIIFETMSQSFRTCTKSSATPEFVMSKIGHIGLQGPQVRQSWESTKC